MTSSRCSPWLLQRLQALSVLVLGIQFTIGFGGFGFQLVPDLGFSVVDLGFGLGWNACLEDHGT